MTGIKQRQGVRCRRSKMEEAEEDGSAHERGLGQPCKHLLACYNTSADP